MKKISTIGYIFSNGPSFYNTDGPAKWVKFDKNISLYTCLRNIKKKICTYSIFSRVWIITLNAYVCKYVKHFIIDWSRFQQVCEQIPGFFCLRIQHNKQRRWVPLFSWYKKWCQLHKKRYEHRLSSCGPVCDILQHERGQGLQESHLFKGSIYWTVWSRSLWWVDSQRKQSSLLSLRDNFVYYLMQLLQKMCYSIVCETFLSLNRVQYLRNIIPSLKFMHTTFFSIQ